MSRSQELLLSGTFPAVTLQGNEQRQFEQSVKNNQPNINSRCRPRKLEEVVISLQNNSNGIDEASFNTGKDKPSANP